MSFISYDSYVNKNEYILRIGACIKLLSEEIQKMRTELNEKNQLLTEYEKIKNQITKIKINASQIIFIDDTPVETEDEDGEETSNETTLDNVSLDMYTLNNIVTADNINSFINNYFKNKLDTILCKNCIYSIINIVTDPQELPTPVITEGITNYTYTSITIHVKKTDKKYIDTSLLL